jgi:alpha-amylase
MYNMVRFHNVALNNRVSNWWDNGMDAIAFGRSGRGFIVINNEGFTVSETLQTGMAAGQYCDVITCDNNRPPCGNSGGACRAEITVDSGGLAFFSVPNDSDPVIAIHV